MSSDSEDDKFSSPESSPTAAASASPPTETTPTEPETTPTPTPTHTPTPTPTHTPNPSPDPTPTPTPTTPTPTPQHKPSPAGSQSTYRAATDSLSPILNAVPGSLSASSLLHDPSISSQITTLLRHPDSGAGDNHLCRWLYDTFQSSDPDLQLVVLRYIPLIAGLYLSRVTQRRPLAGFEAVFLALYAHETTSRGGQAISVTLPDLSNPSVYHESNSPVRNNATELNIAVISPSLEPHGTVRSTKRARIVGVALELYYSKILNMPVGSKLDFCEFCEAWAGQDGGVHREGGERKAIEGGREGSAGGAVRDRVVEGGRVPLPWELLQPCLRILGHCLMGVDKNKNKALYEKACGACRCLYARALHDINPKAILAAGSLLKLIKLEAEADNFDPTEIPDTCVISL